jgi:hypothetical protein
MEDETDVQRYKRIMRDIRTNHSLLTEMLNEVSTAKRIRDATIMSAMTIAGHLEDSVDIAKAMLKYIRG